MKRIITVLLTLLLSLSFCFSQNPQADAFLREDISRVACNYHGYEFKDYKYSRVPKGYEMVYLSHYGRHGSRYMTYTRGHEYVIKKLTQLQKAGLLNADGEELLRQTKEMLVMNEKNLHNLSPKGYQEQARIAERMFAREKKFFRKDLRIRGIASTADRCQSSMNSFCGALVRQNPRLTMDLDSKEEYMSYISNTSGFEETVHDKADLIIDSLNNTILNPREAIRPLVTDLDEAYKLFNRPVRFEKYLHVVASIAEDLPVHYRPMKLIPFEEARKLWYIKNLDLYLNHCNSVEFGDIRIPYARSLAEDFITKADESLSGGQYDVDLRFGHDYPLMAFFSYIGLDRFNERYDRNHTDNWISSRDMHMATNLQIEFFRGKKGDVIVRFIHNDRETKIPALGPGPFYDWETVKAYWRDRY